MLLRKIIKATAVLASGTVGGQLFVAAVSPVITRLYSPNQFGEFAVYAALLYLMLSFASLRYEIAIPLAQTDEDARHLAVGALAIVVAFSLCTMPVAAFAFSNAKIHQWSHFQWLLPLGVLTGGICNVFIYVNLRQHRHVAVAKARFGQAIGAAIFQIASGFLHFGAVGLIMGQIFGVSLGASRLRGKMTVSPLKAWRSRAEMFNQMRLKKNFALYDSPAALLAVANTHAPILLIAVIFSPAAAGFYALVHRLFSTPLGVISSAISASLVSMGPKVNLNGQIGADIKGMLSLAIIAPISVCGALLSLYLFEPVFGGQWSEAGPVGALMVLYIGQKFAFDAMFTAYAIQGRQKQGLFAQGKIFFARFAVLGLASLVLPFLKCLAIFSLVSAFLYALELQKIFPSITKNSNLRWVFSGADILFPYVLVGVGVFLAPTFWQFAFLCSLYFAWAVIRIFLLIRKS